MLYGARGGGAFKRLSVPHDVEVAVPDKVDLSVAEVGGGERDVVVPFEVAPDRGIVLGDQPAAVPAQPRRKRRQVAPPIAAGRECVAVRACGAAHVVDVRADVSA